MFEFNPYEGVPVRLRHPISEAERKKVKDKEHLAQTTVEITTEINFQAPYLKSR